MKSATNLPSQKMAMRTTILLLSYLFAASPAVGQDILSAGVSITEDNAAAELEAAILSVEARQDLDVDTRASALESLREAQTQLQTKLNADAAAERYAAALDTAPGETDELRRLLDEQPPAAETVESLGIKAGESLAQLQQWLAKATADLTASESELAEFSARVEAEVGRPALIRERIGQLQGSRAELAASVDDPTIVDESQILANARRVSIQLRRAAQGAEINKLEQELLSHAARLNLLRAQRDVAARSHATLQRRAELLRAAVNERQESVEDQVRRAAIEAELAAADKHPVVRSLAEDNAVLAVALPKGAGDIQEASTQLAAIKEKTRSIEQRLTRSRQYVEVGGLSRTTGRLLIEERRSLPQISRYRPRSAEIGEVGLALLFIQEKRRELTSIDDRAQEFVARVVEDDISDEELASIERDIRSLLRSRRDLLLQSENSYRSYLQVLGDLEFAQRRLLASAGEYEEFLNQNLLWIPSAPIAFAGSWGDVASAAEWALSAESWRRSYAALLNSFREHFGIAAIFLLLLSLLVVVRSPLAGVYAAMGQKVGRLSVDNIGLTIGSIVIAAVHALPVPLLFAGTSWFLQKASGATAFSDTIAIALSATAPFLFNTLMLRALCARDGVFKTHFGWHSGNVALVRRQLSKLAVLGAPLFFATAFLFLSESVTENQNLGRFLFVPLMMVLAYIVHPLVYPGSSLPANYYRNNPESWVSRFRWTWYGIAIGVPLTLVLISIMGNVYTSTKLSSLFLETIWFVVSLLIVNMVVLRWLALSRRKLELKILLRKREAEKAEKEAAAQPSVESEPIVAKAEPLDLDAVDQQSRKLLRSSLVFIAAIAGWQIWSDVLPALTLLESVSLWSQMEMIDGVETINPVTLADLLFALLIVLVSVIASRNLPGFLEMVLPRRLNAEPGSRYAIHTLVRYFIIMAGVISVLNIMGWNWSQIQWLAAALTVGLGFGLQEIVANFVSGLVILFERPVRVGDTITVGQLTGTVSRIRIRATTITDWDRKEIIVPNKSFITEQVINWTLTDPITRIVIPVGVSYGSDVALVHKTMEDTLPAIPLVLDEPAPRVYFSGFGESSLDFTLHVYLRQLSDRMPLVHEVHNAIFRALRENGIEIPFPQRDLHIRSTIETND